MAQRLNPNNLNIDYKKVDFRGTQGCMEMHNKHLKDQM